jgi:hypothetical protein
MSSLKNGAILQGALIKCVALFCREFKCKTEFESQPSSDNWLDRLIGSISDNSAFLEALEYGRTFRQSDKPIDGSDR